MTVDTNEEHIENPSNNQSEKISDDITPIQNEEPILQNQKI